MTTLRESIVNDIDKITRLVQDAIIEEVERIDEEISVFVTDALHTRTMLIDPESVITEEVFHKLANDAFYDALFFTLEHIKSSSWSTR